MDESQLISCCRACLKESSLNMRSMATMWNDQIQFWDMLIDVTGADRRNTVPFSVCNKCENLLISAYSFKIMCQKTELLLNKFFEDDDPTLIKSQDSNDPEDFRDNITVPSVDDVVNIYDETTSYTVTEDNIAGDIIENSNDDLWESSNKEEFTPEPDYKIMIANPNAGSIIHNESISLDTSGCILIENHIENNEIKNEYDLDSCQIMLQSNQTHINLDTESPQTNPQQSEMVYINNIELLTENASTDGSTDKYAMQPDFSNEEFETPEIDIKPLIASDKSNTSTDCLGFDEINVTNPVTTNKEAAVENNSDECKPPLQGRKCHVCNLEFENKKGYQLHHRIEHQTRTLCPYCGKLVSKHAMEKHMVIHTKKKDHLCTECGKSFTLSENLKKHWRIHTNDKRYSCEYCGEKFVHWNSKRSHIRATHTGEKTYVFLYYSNIYFFMYFFFFLYIVMNVIYVERCLHNLAICSGTYDSIQESFHIHVHFVKKSL